MGFYLIGPLVTLIPLESISFWAFKPYCDDGLLGISPTDKTYIMAMEEHSELHGRVELAVSKLLAPILIYKSRCLF